MTFRRLAAIGVFLVGMGMAFQACGGGASTPAAPTNTGGSGGSSGGTGGGSGGGGETTPVITITPSGVTPTELRVAPGTRVRFVNNDTRNHTMNSDPHPAHTDCIEINQVGFLTPGQTRETGNLNTVRTCGFHDHELFPQPQWEGRIIIQP